MCTLTIQYSTRYTYLYMSCTYRAVHALYVYILRHTYSTVRACMHCTYARRTVLNILGTKEQF